MCYGEELGREAGSRYMSSEYHISPEPHRLFTAQYTTTPTNLELIALYTFVNHTFSTFTNVVYTSKIMSPLLHA